MKEKDVLQRDAQNKWEESNYKGAIAICTGGGKSKIFVNILKELPEKWLLVVPTTNLRDAGWHNEFKKWNTLTIFNKYVDVCCYASLKNYDLDNYAGVALDEGHRITVKNSEPFFKVTDLEKLKILVLTATFPEDEQKLSIYYRIGIKPVFTLSLDEGVEMGIVSPYKINVIKVPLDEENNITVSFNKGKSSFKTSEVKNYKYLTESIEKNKGKKFYMHSVFNRMRFIYNLKSKTNISTKLLERFGTDERVLIFTQSIKQAEELCVCSYHSESDSKCFDNFMNEVVNKLSVAVKLNEGSNIPNLDAAVITQLTSKDGDLIQRIGRVVRYRPNHVADIYIIVAEGTVDEVWAENALKKLNRENIKYTRL